MKGNPEIVLGIVAIVAILLFVLFLMFSGYGTMLGFPMYQSPGTINVNLPGGDTSPTAPSAPRQSISDIFHAAIDPYAPTFLYDASVNCAAYGGVWYDGAERMGCFGMAPGLFDPTTCPFPPMSDLALECNSISGATWQCDSTNAGCYYA